MVGCGGWTQIRCGNLPLIISPFWLGGEEGGNASSLGGAKGSFPRDLCVFPQFEAPDGAWLLWVARGRCFSQQVLSS